MQLIDKKTWMKTIFKIGIALRFKTFKLLRWVQPHFWNPEKLNLFFCQEMFISVYGIYELMNGKKWLDLKTEAPSRNIGGDSELISSKFLESSSDVQT